MNEENLLIIPYEDDEETNDVELDYDDTVCDGGGDIEDEDTW